MKLFALIKGTILEAARMKGIVMYSLSKWFLIWTVALNSLNSYSYALCWMQFFSWNIFKNAFLLLFDFIVSASIEDDKFDSKFYATKLFFFFVFSESWGKYQFHLSNWNQFLFDFLLFIWRLNFQRKKRTKKEVAKPEKKVEKAEPEPPPREPTPGRTYNHLSHTIVKINSKN